LSQHFGLRARSAKAPGALSLPEIKAAADTLWLQITQQYYSVNLVVFLKL